jgi:methionine aminopeptidase
MRAASQLAARALQLAGNLVQPGVTTDQLDAAVHNFIIANGGYPSPLGYHGFPKSICTSVNEVVCHGIPDSRCACGMAMASLPAGCSFVFATAGPASLQQQHSSVVAGG